MVPIDTYRANGFFVEFYWEGMGLAGGVSSCCARFLVLADEADQDFFLVR